MLPGPGGKARGHGRDMTERGLFAVVNEVSHPEAQELFVGIVANHDFNFLTTRQNSLFGRNSQGSAVRGPIVKVSWAPGARLGFLFLVFSGPPTLK